ncbi:MAG: NAD(P)-dependent oxidoreductase [Opitutales bacterium]|nr:NAD(P)-dependent oxidoreductase [Opitutales bacterium]
MKKRILLTGASGCIGRYVREILLQKEFEVYAPTRRESPAGGGIHWIKGDILDGTFIDRMMAGIKPECLLHLAWNLEEGHYQSNKNYSFLSSGIRLAQAFAENGGKRALYIGSFAEYATSDRPLKETDALDLDQTHYAFCKHHLHEIAERYFRVNGVSFGYARISFNFGARNIHRHRFMGLLLEHFRNDQPLVIKGGSLLRDFIYVKDTTAALVQFLGSDVEGTVNICTGKATSTKDFVTLFAKKVGKEHLLVFKDDCADQVPIQFGDTTRLVKEVGYTPRYTVEQGLSEIAEEFLKAEKERKTKN